MVVLSGWIESHHEQVRLRCLAPALGRQRKFLSSYYSWDIQAEPCGNLLETLLSIHSRKFRGFFSSCKRSLLWRFRNTDWAITANENQIMRTILRNLKVERNSGPFERYAIFGESWEACHKPRSLKRGSLSRLFYRLDISRMVIEDHAFLEKSNCNHDHLCFSGRSVDSDKTWRCEKIY